MSGEHSPNAVLNMLSEIGRPRQRYIGKAQRESVALENR